VNKFLNITSGAFDGHKVKVQFHPQNNGTGKVCMSKTLADDADELACSSG
tara:strand:- start:209 stop:358 length:150 start_codon:yes stop_codon:yes gene_type:complete